jgi:hypothetical protein
MSRKPSLFIGLVALCVGLFVFALGSQAIYRFINCPKGQGLGGCIAYAVQS